MGHPSRRDLKSQFHDELLRAAQKGGTVTYGHLMSKFGLSRGRGIVRLLGEVDRQENVSGAPGFAALVVRKDTGFPGGGYFCDNDLPVRLRRPARRSTDPSLSPEEEEHVRVQQRKIWSYYSKSEEPR